MSGRYGAAIHWLETAPGAPRAPLAGDHDVDVAVVGGGFTGLWTAYHLLRADPGLSVTVLEREEVGYGASGRNGGFAMTLLDMSLAHLRRNHGDEAARAAHQAVAASVTEIGATAAAEGIDCEWRHGGLMVVATNPAQLERVDADLRAADALGLEGFSRLSAAQARAAVNSPTYLGALHEDHCGVLHPAKLARGLADTVERLGGRVHERSGLQRLTEAGDGRLAITTAGGTLRAAQVVLATNAWAATTPWFRDAVVPLYTYVLLTEPLSEAQWAAVGWDDHRGIEDKRNFVHYYRRTADGRILWGGTDGLIGYPSHRIVPVRDRDDGVFGRLAATFRRTFPQLSAVAFTHRWGGPVAITGTFLPLFGTLLDGRLHYGLGYNGHGVAPSHTGGKILRDKVLGRASGLTRLCFVDVPAVQFPPDPVRWIAAELTRQALRRQDRGFDAGQAGGEMDPLLLRAMRALA
jgi:glycine/D-amino acid oxidase-like deaminating enzyme